MYVGFGAVVSADGTDITYPWYCNFLPALISGDECDPATQAQLTAMQTAQLAQVAAVNPALAAQGIAAGNSATAALMNSDPSDAAAYNAAVNSPTLSSIFGTDITNWATGTNPNTNQPTNLGLGNINWWLVGGIGVAVLLFLHSGGGRR